MRKGAGIIMDQSKIMEMTERYVQHTYNRFPISIDRGDGVRVWDSEGKEYLDFMAGMASARGAD